MRFSVLISRLTAYFCIWICLGTGSSLVLAAAEDSTRAGDKLSAPALEEKAPAPAAEETQSFKKFPVLFHEKPVFYLYSDAASADRTLARAAEASAALENA